MSDAVAAMNKSRISVIVLAAGESRRMGGRNKLHLPVAGTPLLRRSVDTLVRAQLGEILVVLGHESANTRVLLEGLPVSTVYNDDYASGQMTSVHCGLAALSQDCDGVMVALGDQPALAGDRRAILRRPGGAASWPSRLA